MWLKVGINLHIFLIYFARWMILSLRDHVTFRTWSCACVCEGWMSFWVVFDFSLSILPLCTLFFCSSKIVGSLVFVSFSFLFREMESFWWTTFDRLYWWTCILNDQSTWWSWHFSKGNDVWSSSKCQKIAMWVQFYSLWLWIGLVRLKVNVKYSKTSN